jgi:hypothetical protein
MTTAAPTLGRLFADHALEIRLTEDGYRVTHAPEHVHIETAYLMWLAGLGACRLICRDHCDGHRCTGHEPVAPVPGEHVILGSRNGDTGQRAVYRVHAVHRDIRQVHLVQVEAGAA